MSRKNEFTDQEIADYVRHLERSKAKYDIELKKVQRQLDRIQSKIDNPEVSLRKDVKEKILGVLNAIGRSAPGKKTTKSTAPMETDSVPARPSNTTSERKEEGASKGDSESKKSSWGW